MSDEVVIVFDVDLGRPACAILQAVYGGSRGVESLFNAEAWLTSPTDGMRRYRIDRETLRKVAAAVNMRFPVGRWLD